LKSYRSRKAQIDPESSSGGQKQMLHQVRKNNLKKLSVRVQWITFAYRERQKQIVNKVRDDKNRSLTKLRGIKIDSASSAEKQFKNNIISSAVEYVCSSVGKRSD
jgi:hypothetical protein